MASTDPDAMARIGQALGDDLALVCLFAAPDADFTKLTRDAAIWFPSSDVLACTTAGELGAQGYETGQIVAVGFPSMLFEAATLVIEGLDQLNEPALIDRLIAQRMDLTRRAPAMTSEFAFTLIDGLSQREEYLTAVLSSALGPVPLFGGSSGDGQDFGRTLLSRNGEVFQNAALVATLRSHCPVEVFSLDHLEPIDTRMVVTKADPATRTVLEINAAPAAQEYARLLGLNPVDLDPYTFAAHPVAVRLGQSHHVRAIQHVEAGGALRFFSAIDEGMVLSLTRPQDIVEHLDRSLTHLARNAAPDYILGFDCLLRRMDAGRGQQERAVSAVLRAHNVVGFSTYGEQIGGLHVNQTLTGVAIFPPVGP